MTEKEWIQYNKKLDQAARKKLEVQYANLYDKLTKDINHWWATYSKDNNMSMSDAMNRVNSFDIKKMEEAIKEAGNIKNLSEVDKANLKAYNATMKINQLELMKAQLGLDIIDSGVNSSFVDELSIRSIEQYERMASILGESTFHNNRIIQQLIHGQKYFGSTWQERLAKVGNALTNDVADLVSQALISGDRHPKDYYKQIEDYVNMSKRKAQNLLTTYAALVQGQAQLDSYEKYDYDELIYVAEHDSKTCDICSGLDGKIIKRKDAVAGVNFYPMHSSCRCSSSAYLNREAVMRKLRKKIRKGEKATKIPDQVATPEPVAKIMGQDIEAFEKYQKLMGENALVDEVQGIKYLYSSDVGKAGSKIPIQYHNTIFEGMPKYTDEQIEALGIYSDHSYSSINKALRKGDLSKLSDRNQKAIKEIMATFKPSPTDLKFYRGDSRRFEGIKPGDIIQDIGINSISTRYRVAENFSEGNTVFEILAPKGTPITNMLPHSIYKREFEVLMRPGTPMEVVEVVTNGKGLTTIKVVVKNA